MSTPILATLLFLFGIHLDHRTLSTRWLNTICDALPCLVCVDLCGRIERCPIENLNGIAKYKAPEGPEDKENDCTNPKGENMLGKWLGNDLQIKLDYNEQLRDDDTNQHPRLTTNFLAFTKRRFEERLIKTITR